VLQFPLKLGVQVCSPSVQIFIGVTLEPAILAGDAQRHATLNIDCSVVEGNAEPANVRITRREESLAQVRQGTVGTHDVESVLCEIVVDCFVAKLSGYQEQLGLAMRWCAGWLRDTRVKQRQPCVGDGITVPALEDMGEANVVMSGSSIPADVYVTRTKEIVEYLELELSWKIKQGGAMRRSRISKT
jgi:hypothetical protein